MHVDFKYTKQIAKITRSGLFQYILFLLYFKLLDNQKQTKFRTVKRHSFLIRSFELISIWTR